MIFISAGHLISRALFDTSSEGIPSCILVLTYLATLYHCTLVLARIDIAVPSKEQSNRSSTFRHQTLGPFCGSVFKGLSPDRRLIFRHYTPPLILYYRTCWTAGRIVIHARYPAQNHSADILYTTSSTILVSFVLSNRHQVPATLGSSRRHRHITQQKAVGDWTRKVTRERANSRGS